MSMIQLTKSDAKLIRSCLLYKLAVVEQHMHLFDGLPEGRQAKLERDSIIVLLAKIEGGAA